MPNASPLRRVPVDRVSLYRERLIPGVMWWLVVAGIVAMVAIAYGAALGATVGWVVGAGLGAIAAVSLLRSSPIIEVFDDRLRCGRAVIPRGDLVDPRVVGTDQMSAIRRGHHEGVGDRVYQVLPAWLANAGVLMELMDEQDPHSAWLIASRRPDALHAALSTRVAD